MLRRPSYRVCQGVNDTNQRQHTVFALENVLAETCSLNIRAILESNRRSFLSHLNVLSMRAGKQTEGAFLEIAGAPVARKRLPARLPVKGPDRLDLPRYC